MTQLPPDRTWSTWDYRYPGCFVHAPSKFAVKVAMFSGKEGRYEDFTSERQSTYELGPHSADGSFAELLLRHAGTTLSLEFAKPNWAGVTGRLRVIEPGEMLFRLVLLIEAGFLRPDGHPPDGTSAPLERVTLEDAPPGRAFQAATAAYATWRSQHFCIAVSPRPTTSNTYPVLAGVGEELEQQGWLFRAEHRPNGSWAAFRFLGDPKVDVHFAVGHATDRESARAAADRRLHEAPELFATKPAADDPSRDAPRTVIRDVMAWNTVWDDGNARPYTCLTRSWVRHLGGWGIWLSDVLYNSLLNAAAGDSYMARENLRSVLAGQQPDGNLPCLLAGYEEWVDRTQLPVACYVTWRVYLLTGDVTLLEEAYPTLRRHLAWFASHRDGNRNGLFEYGSTPTGSAHNTHTKQGAMNESGMDNMPIFDDAVFNPASNTLEFEEPGHNSLLALEAEMLARIARTLRRDEDAQELEDAASSLRLRISTELWDPEREIFAGRFWSGAFARQLSPTSFFPLIAGAATEEQTDALIAKHLTNESEFWAPMPLPSTPFDDPISRENSYWRGRIWPPLNYFTWEGLRRAGREQLAADLAERSWQMFRAEWVEKRHCHENFHISDPTRHESPDSDVFYSWGALIPLMRAAESADVSPWDGLTLGDLEDGADAKLVLPGREYEYTCRNGVAEVIVDGRPLFRLSPATRVTQLSVTDGVAFAVSRGASDAYRVTVLTSSAARQVRAYTDSSPVDSLPSVDGGYEFEAKAGARIAFTTQGEEDGDAQRT